jgi:hypothetical protein
MLPIGLLNTHYSLHIVPILYTGSNVAIKTGHVLNYIEPFEINHQQFRVHVS